MYVSAYAWIWIERCMDIGTHVHTHTLIAVMVLGQNVYRWLCECVCVFVTVHAYVREWARGRKRWSPSV